MLIHILIPCFFSYGTVMRPWMKSDCAPLEGGDWKPLLHFRANSAVGDSKSPMAEIFWWKAMSGSSFLGIAMDIWWLQTHIYGGEGLAYLIHRMNRFFRCVLKKNLLELHSIHWISRELSGNGRSLKAKSATNVRICVRMTWLFFKPKSLLFYLELIGKSRTSSNILDGIRNANPGNPATSFSILSDDPVPTATVNRI